MKAVAGLSVIVIAKNEERDIEGCLASVRELASEIVLVDAGSTDRTVALATPIADKVLHREWNGFGPQKQFALDNARGPWILNIDADERVTPALADEIRRRVSTDTPEAGFRLPFRHFFLGRRLRFGSGARETHVRLFRKDRASYGETRIHEGIQVRGPIGRLSGAVEHWSYRDVSEYLEKCNRYTTLIAEAKYGQGRRLRPWHHLRLPFEFLMRYGIKGGFLDGRAGLIYATLSSYYVWLKFVKLLDIERRSL